MSVAGKTTSTDTLLPVYTGEEDEQTVYQCRAKLYVMQADGGWKERGVGALRLNVRAGDKGGPRLGTSSSSIFYFRYRALPSPFFVLLLLVAGSSSTSIPPHCSELILTPLPVMRAEGVLRLILNVSLYVGMACLEDGKHVRSTVFEDNEKRFITFRVSRHRRSIAMPSQQAGEAGETHTKKTGS